MMFQLRHKDLGIFQGAFLGCAFFYLSECPNSDIELGLCDFDTEEKARDCRDWMIDLSCPLNASDDAFEPFTTAHFTVEPYGTGLTPEELLALEGVVKVDPTSSKPLMEVMEILADLISKTS